MLRAVLFDLDGTLMDHDAAREAGLRAHLGDWLPEVEAGELGPAHVARISTLRELPAVLAA